MSGLQRGFPPAWCVYNEKRFGARFAVRDVVFEAANRKGIYNVAVITNRWRMRFAAPQRVSTIKATKQNQKPNGDHVTFLETGHGY